jgi:hypothetical protein
LKVSKSESLQQQWWWLKTWPQCRGE